MMISVSTAIDIPIKVDSPHNAIWSMPPINTVVIPANTIGILFSQVLRRNLRCTNSSRKVRISSLTVIAAKEGI